MGLAGGGLADHGLAHHGQYCKKDANNVYVIRYVIVIRGRYWR